MCFVRCCEMLTIRSLLLLDVAPIPRIRVTPGGLVFVAIAVLMLTGAAVSGFVFLVRRLLLRARHQVMQASVPPKFQPNSPNQP